MVSLCLLDKLKKTENSLIKVLSFSDGIVEVDPVVVLTDVAHDYGAESTAETTAVNRWSRTAGPTSLLWVAKTPFSIENLDVSTKSAEVDPCGWQKPRRGITH